jgi:hypothetical protein
MATMMKTHAVQLMFIATLTLGVGCGTRSQPPMVTKDEPASSEQVAHPTTTAASPTTWPTALPRTQWSWLREGARDRAVIVIYRKHAWNRVFQPDLITAMWADGEVIWSADPVLGGAPYWRGRIEPAAFRDLRDRMTDAAARSGSPPGAAYTGPDASYNIIYFRTADGRVFSIGSWGDPYPDDDLAGRDEHAWPRVAETWREMQTARDSEHWNYGSIVRLWGTLRGAVYEALPMKKEQVQQPPVHVVQGGGA